MSYAFSCIYTHTYTPTISIELMPANLEKKMRHLTNKSIYNISFVPWIWSLSLKQKNKLYQNAFSMSYISHIYLSYLEIQRSFDLCFIWFNLFQSLTYHIILYVVCTFGLWTDREYCCQAMLFIISTYTITIPQSWNSLIDEKKTNYTHRVVCVYMWFKALLASQPDEWCIYSMLNEKWIVYGVREIYHVTK